MEKQENENLNGYIKCIGYAFYTAITLLIVTIGLYEFDAISKDLKGLFLTIVLALFLLSDTFLGCYFGEMQSGPIQFSLAKSKWKFIFRISLSALMLLFVCLDVAFRIDHAF